VVVSDIMMPNMSGLELLLAIRQRDLEVPVILLTGMSNMDAAVEAKRHGALNYLTKPVNNERLVLAVSRAGQLRSPPRSQISGWRTSRSFAPRIDPCTPTRRSCAAGDIAAPPRAILDAAERLDRQRLFPPFSWGDCVASTPRQGGPSGARAPAQHGNGEEADAAPAPFHPDLPAVQRGV
jgi:hypothetical protein